MTKSSKPQSDGAEVIKQAFQVYPEDYPKSARKVRDLLKETGKLFERARVPVQLSFPSDGSPPRAEDLHKRDVVHLIHERFQPFRYSKKGEVDNITLPGPVADLAVHLKHWGLPPLVGITTAPILDDEGRVRFKAGYDEATGLWCHTIPQVKLPDKPSLAQAKASLKLLRETFKTFPFIDSPLIKNPKLKKVPQVDVTKAPGQSESAFLVGLLTAVCRQSLWLSPGFVIRAAAMSGAGSGKGLLFRSACAVAFGWQPPAITVGHDLQELDKRVSSFLMKADQAVFLDNVNLDSALRANSLASVLTERPAEVRPLGQSKMVPLNCTAFIGITGNGLRLSEDLVRRFISCELDAKCEDPELRPFARGFSEQIKERRGELLSAVLTIWRFGRQQKIDKGMALGSYEDWSEWVRDPLLALGCQDPVKAIKESKAVDPARQRVIEIFDHWWDLYKNRSMTAKQLWDGINAPQGDKTIADMVKSQSRQQFTSWLDKHVNTYVGGYVLLRNKEVGKWSTAHYNLEQFEQSRNHRGS